MLDLVARPRNQTNRHFSTEMPTGNSEPRPLIPFSPFRHSLSTSNQASRRLSPTKRNYPKLRRTYDTHRVWGNLVKHGHAKRILCCCSCAASKDKITTLKQARGPSGVFRCGIYANASNAASFDRHRRGTRCRISVKGGTIRWYERRNTFSKVVRLRQARSLER